MFLLRGTMQPYCNENDYIKAEKNIGINLDSWKTP